MNNGVSDKNGAIKSMLKAKYQRKKNDVIVKGPIEAGIEILAYNLLDECIDESEYSLVDINRIERSQDPRLNTDVGIPDMGVFSNDFQFGEINKGCVYGFVEVKAAGKGVRETKQFEGEVKAAKRLIYTNGLVWKIYCNGKLQDEINLMKGDEKPYSLIPVEIDEKKLGQLQDILKSIDWKN